MANRLGKAHILLFHYKTEHVTALTAAEAMENLPFRIYRKGGCFLGVKGTKALEAPAALFQRQKFRHDIFNGVGTSDVVKQILGEKTGQQFLIRISEVNIGFSQKKTTFYRSLPAFSLAETTVITVEVPVEALGMKTAQEVLKGAILL